MRQKATVTGQQIERNYNDNIQQYSTPEQVRASHILLKTEGKEDAAVKKEAEDLLAQIKKGANFEELARKHSQDEVSAAKGGDLDFFGRGRMVAEFDKTAFELPVGQMSDLVKTSFGYHIIKVTDKRAASQRTLAEVRTQIEDSLKWEQAQAAAQKLADQVVAELKKPADFETVARARGLQTGESGLFQQDEPIAGIGMSPAVSQAAFQLKENEISEPLRTPQGYAFVTVTGKQAPYLPQLDEVKTRVRDDVVKQKSIETARQKAAGFSAELKSSAEMKSGDFDKAAKAAGLEVKSTELIARGSPIAEVGVSPALEAAAFSLPAGAVSDPIVTETGAAIVKVVERKDVAADELAKQKDTLRGEMLNEKKQKFFAAYMTKARQRMKININRETIAQIIG
jgi:peptidyl-prolyl cis-trans isomerase D